jgi:hypothetical protein
MGGYADILHPFIWSHLSGMMRFRDGSDRGTASNFVQSAAEILLWIDTRSAKKACSIQGKSEFTEYAKGETG